MNKRIYLWSGLLLVLLACNLGAPPPAQTSDLLATLAASTPLTGSPVATVDPAQTSTSPFNLQTPIPSTLTVPTSIFNLSTPLPSTVSVPTSSSTLQPMGKIVFTCQIFKVQASNQICIINADGTGFRRLTTDNTQHYYPSLSPDGKSVVYAAFLEANIYEIYEINLATGSVKKLTNKIGNINAPEISPDGTTIVFKRAKPSSEENQIYLMERNGTDPNNIPKILGWDPTWAPDGQHILFASDRNGTVQLYTMNLDGKELHQISNLPAIRGRSDWSADGQFIVTY